MYFGLIILIRILFVACMVFIIGYVFGSFSRNRTLSVITKVAAILVIALFIAANISLMAGGWHRACFGDGHPASYHQQNAPWQER